MKYIITQIVNSVIISFILENKIYTVCCYLCVDRLACSGYYKYSVIPWLDHGIQKKLKKRLDTVVKPRYDTERTTMFFCLAGFIYQNNTIKAPSIKYINNILTI
ncbi:MULTISPECIES: hypothetical protein [unclassified Rickettsia]|uniref:hypothetical protein n=1 Tax=unclassified Rickettsia TaxID=114295 RepID=UPI00313317CA